MIKGFKGIIFTPYREILNMNDYTLFIAFRIDNIYPFNLEYIKNGVEKVFCYL